MQYQSLIRFLEYTSTEYTAETPNISRLRKQTAAEFAMQPDGIIVIDRVSYTRNDVLKEIEDPAFASRLQSHKLIWEHKSLLELLEQDRVDLEEVNWYHLHKNAEFVAFLSPYFGASFNSVLKTLLQRREMRRAAIWMNYLDFVLPAQREEALRSARMFLDDAVRLFRNMNEVSFRSRGAEFATWYLEPWSLFVNKLPEDMLHYADELANVMINFTVRIQKEDRQICYKISLQLAALTGVNFSLRELIRKNHAIYAQNAKGKTVGGRFKNSSIYVIVAIVIFVIRILASTSHSSDDTPTFSASDLEAKMELASYKNVRNFYTWKYQGDSASLSELEKIPFAPSNTYIVIEGSWDGASLLFPFVFRNNTARGAEINIVRDNNVFYLDARSKEYISFQPKDAKSIDMIVSFGKEGKWTEDLNPGYQNMQYIRIAPERRKGITNPEFRDSDPIDLPYFSLQELDSLPLQIVIKEQNGKCFYEIKGKARIVTFKTIASEL